MTIDETERSRFCAWTFEQELALLEDNIGDFDRGAASADPDIARFAMELQSCSEDEDSEAIEDDRCPRFLGHDMKWWARLTRWLMWRDGSLPPCLLDHLGIRDAVVGYIKAENAWKASRTAVRRKASRQGRNWLSEMLPKVR